MKCAHCTIRVFYPNYFIVDGKPYCEECYKLLFPERAKIQLDNRWSRST
jgi:hypothetical protein